jgi:hypothetical protein
VSGTYSTWSSMLVVGLAMLVLGVKLNVLSLPAIATRRCGACGRLLRRRSVCRCARCD